MVWLPLAENNDEEFVWKFFIKKPEKGHPDGEQNAQAQVEKLQQVRP